MRAERLLTVALLLGAGGCAPPDASAQLDAFTHFLYREWADGDATQMQDGVARLDQQLATLNFDGGTDGRSFRVTPLQRGDLATVSWPMDHDPQKAIGSCVARRSEWPIDDQARFIISPDQLAAEPTAKSYVRTFVDPTDPSCFVGQGCPVLLTDNQITRDTAVLTVAFLLHKNLRWVRLGEDRWAIAARSFTDRPYPGQKSGTGIQQSYSLDLFLAQADARTVRYQCSWSQTDVGFALDDDLALSVLVGSVDSAMAATDKAIGKLFHGQ
jgi:hypothetical protein